MSCLLAGNRCMERHLLCLGSIQIEHAQRPSVAEDRPVWWGTVLTSGSCHARSQQPAGEWRVLVVILGTQIKRDAPPARSAIAGGISEVTASKMVPGRHLRAPLHLVAHRLPPGRPRLGATEVVRGEATGAGMRFAGAGMIQGVHPDGEQPDSLSLAFSISR